MGEGCTRLAAGKATRGAWEFLKPGPWKGSFDEQKPEKSFMLWYSTGVRVKKIKLPEATNEPHLRHH